MTERRPIGAAQRVATEFSGTAAIVIVINEDRGNIIAASWGKDRATCRKTAPLCDAAYQAVVDAWNS